MSQVGQGFLKPILFGEILGLIVVFVLNSLSLNNLVSTIKESFMIMNPMFDNINHLIMLRLVLKPIKSIIDAKKWPFGVDETS